MNLTKVFSYIFSALVVLFFVGISLFLVVGGAGAIGREGWSFILDADWYYRSSQFGAAAMIYGSCVVAIVAIVLGAPLGIGAAIFTSQYLKGSVRLLIKGLMELLAGIPSVVYGLLGVLFLRPMLFEVSGPFHPESGDTLLTAGIIVGVMIIPTILSLCDDAFMSVSHSDRESARSLGLSRSEMFFHAIVPKALPGVVAAVLLGVGRAIGETIAVFLVVGRADNRMPDPWYSLRPMLEAGQTLTSKLGGAEVYLAYGSEVHWQAILGLGLVLFVIVMILVVMAGLFMLSQGKYQTS